MSLMGSVKWNNAGSVNTPYIFSERAGKVSGRDGSVLMANTPFALVLFIRRSGVSHRFYMRTCAMVR